MNQMKEILQRLENLETRLAKLEERPTPSAPKQEFVVAPTPSLDEPEYETDISAEGISRWVGGTTPLVGRMLLALGGAFLIRAITESELVPQLVGTALGIAYALVWVGLIDYAASRNHRESAHFHGFVAAMIAFPLLWEATVKFKFISPTVSAIIMAVITVLALTIAWRRNLRVLAWIMTLCAGPMALALAFGTWKLLPFMICLLSFGLFTLWLGYSRKWYFLAAFVALLIDFTMFLFPILMITKPDLVLFEHFGPMALLNMQFVFALIYFGSFATRTLLRRKDVSVFEIIQALLVFGVGLGGAVAVVKATGMASAPIGFVSLFLAVGNYGISFSFIDRQLGRKKNFFFYTTLALLLTLVALGLLLKPALLAITFAAMALCMTWVGNRWQRITLRVHGGVYAAAAAIFSGLFHQAVLALTGPEVELKGWMNLPMLLVLAIVAICSWFPELPHAAKGWSILSRSTRFIILAVLTFCGTGLLVTLGAELLPKGEGGVPDPSYLAVLRTGFLASLAVLLAWAASWKRYAPASWFVYPVLILGGLKLILEDFPTGRPSTLFISFALYGVALIIAPRLSRRG